jgi:hypothetical protein
VKIPPAEPALLEWNFSDCPADELSTCHCYEYTRSSALIRQTVKRKREGAKDPLAGAVFLLFPINALWIVSGPHSHWWPDTPYLAIPHEERRSQLHFFRQDLDLDRDLAEFCNPWTNLNEIERFVLVYIPPGWPLSRLKKGFAQLLLRDHAHLLKKPVQSFKWTKPGKGSPKEQWRSALATLSALRLREHGYTAAQALALAGSHRVRLYASERAYRDAVRKAKTRIAGFEERLRYFAANEGTALDHQNFI